MSFFEALKRFLSGNKAEAAIVLPARPALPKESLVPQSTVVTDYHEPNALIAARTVLGPLPPDKLVYDPAFQHYQNGFKAKELPLYPVERQAYLHIKLDLMHEFLRLLQESPLADALVLRGSVCLHHWFPGQARPPGDLDFVAHRRNIDTRQIKSIIPPLLASLQAEGLGFGRVAEDAIWTYARVEGSRWTLPWKSEAYQGTIQVDVTFDELLPEEPDILEFQHRGLVLRQLCASKQLSLGWKLIWLESDFHPQGKDLYDAVLLAESVLMPEDLLGTLRRKADLDRCPFRFKDLIENCDWDNFIKEGAPTSDSMEVWSQRLQASIAHLES